MCGGRKNEEGEKEELERKERWVEQTEKKNETVGSVQFDEVNRIF